MKSDRLSEEVKATVMDETIRQIQDIWHENKINANNLKFLDELNLQKAPLTQLTLWMPIGSHKGLKVQTKEDTRTFNEAVLLNTNELNHEVFRDGSEEFVRA